MCEYRGDEYQHQARADDIEENTDERNRSVHPPNYNDTCVKMVDQRKTGT